MNNNYSDRGNDSSDESHSEDNNDVGNQNEAVDEDLTYEQYKSIIDLTANDVRGMEFGSEEHACKFYDSYARCHGFVARKDDIKRDAEDNIIMRQLVCNKEGLRNKKHFIRLDRKRPHRPITRTSCQAKLRVHFDYKRSKWTVLSFVETHNHYLCPPRYRHLIPAHRKMGDTDKAQAESLHSYGVRTCHIMGYMLAQKDSDVMSGAAAAACNRLCSIAREKNACFNDILNDIFKLLNKYENQGDPNSTVRSSFKDVGDPYLVKTKGAPSKKKYGRKRRCSNCSRPGHIARKCPRLLSTDNQVPMDGDSSHSDGDGFTIGEENDKEGNLVDQCDDQQIGSKNQSRMRKDNNVKGKGTGSFKMKEKTVNRSTHNSVKQLKIEPMVSSSDANADNPQHQNSNPVYATTSQGVNISPHHGGGDPIIPLGSLNGVNTLYPQRVCVLPQQQNFTNVYGPISQGANILPHHGGVSNNPQVPQVAFFPQRPQVCLGMSCWKRSLKMEVLSMAIHHDKEFCDVQCCCASLVVGY
ncbi:Zinc finger, CCHC-type [Sesbania bispinosa]|nr:Zinc finger, CCHC-type [Sesbania bispinosa]